MKQNKSETLLQREKAQRDLLELKKMQRGEIEPEKQDQAIKPETFSEKRENFLYYHKYKVLAFIFFAVVLGFLIYNTATKVRYDAKIVFFSFDFYTDEVCEKSSDYFEQFYKDINENGNVDVLTVNCSFDQNGRDAEYAKTMLTKVQVLLMGENDTMLYILDKDSLKFLDNISDSVDLFDKENAIKLSDKYFGYLGIEEKEELFLCLRTVDGTTLEKSAKESYNAALEVLKQARAAQ